MILIVFTKVPKKHYLIKTDNAKVIKDLAQIATVQ